MAITRRQFIKRTGLATAGTLLGPGLFGSPFVRRALADTIGDRYLVVLFLDGGNDGLNTVTPYDDGTSATLRAHYETNRKIGTGGIRLLQSELNATRLDGYGGVNGLDPNTGTPLALHPGFAPLFAGSPSAWSAGDVAVIQGCGYPFYNLSHDESRRIWRSANPLSVGAYAGTGWCGRHLAAEYGSTDIPGVCIGGEVAGELAQTATGVLSMYDLADFTFPYDDQYSDDVDAKKTAFQALYGSARGNLQPGVRYIGDTGTATFNSTELYNALSTTYDNDTSQDVFRAEWESVNRSTVRDLHEITKVIYGVSTGAQGGQITARFFSFDNGGYDTHSDQGGADPNGQHYGLHNEVATALDIFRRHSIALGTWNKTLVVVWSEFSRRIPQNDNGTDHGSQGPVLVLGGGVNGGVYGNHPDIDPNALDDDENTPYSQNPSDPFRSTDIRDVYGTILKHWLNMPVAQITGAGGVLPVDPGTEDPNLTWQSPNLDLGFI